MADMEDHSGDRNSKIPEPLHRVSPSDDSKDLFEHVLYLDCSWSEEQILKTAREARIVSPDQTLPKCCWARRLDACEPSRSLHRYDVGVSVRVRVDGKVMISSCIASGLTVVCVAPRIRVRIRIS